MTFRIAGPSLRGTISHRQIPLTKSYSCQPLMIFIKYNVRMTSLWCASKRESKFHALCWCDYWNCSRSKLLKECEHIIYGKSCTWLCYLANKIMICQSFFTCIFCYIKCDVFQVFYLIIVPYDKAKCVIFLPCCVNLHMYTVNSVGYSYLSLPQIPASGTKVLTSTWYTVELFTDIIVIDGGCIRHIADIPMPPSFV